MTAGLAAAAVPASASVLQDTGSATPAAPRDVDARPGAGTLTVTWTAAGSPRRGYTVSCTSPDGGPRLTRHAGRAATSVQLVGLPDNRTYGCSVVAVGPGGASAPALSPYVTHAVLDAATTQAVLRVPVTSGQRFSVITTGTTLPADCTTQLELQGLRGGYLASSCGGAPGFVATPRAVGTAGTARASLTSTSGATGSSDLVAYPFTDVAVATAIGGPAATATLHTPGQRAYLSFHGRAQEQVTLSPSGNTLGSGLVSLRAPDGRQLTIASTAATFLDTTTLPSTGTYVIEVDAVGPTTGSLAVEVDRVPRNTGAIQPDGPAVPVTLRVPGQNGVRTFSGTAGQQVTLTMSGNTFTLGEIRVLDAAGDRVTSNAITSHFLDDITLPYNGTYTVVVDPAGTQTGRVTVALAIVPDNSGTIELDGPAIDVHVTTPGQNPTRTFSGAAGTTVTLDISGNTIVPVYVKIVNAHGGDLQGTSISSSSGSLSSTLYGDGPYTVSIDPQEAATGVLTLTLHG